MAAETYIALPDTSAVPVPEVYQRLAVNTDYVVIAREGDTQAVGGVWVVFIGYICRSKPLATVVKHQIAAARPVADQPDMVSIR